MRSSTCASFRRYERQQRERVRAHDDAQPKVADVQVGMLGLGVLGMDAALKLKAVGFLNAGWSATQKSVAGFDWYSGDEGLRRLLSRTDILVALLPLTNQTRGLLDASLFAQLKQDGRLGGPVLVNAGPGGLQVEADILAALESLDVFERAPLPVDSALPSRRLREPAQRSHPRPRRHRRRHCPPD